MLEQMLAGKRVLVVEDEMLVLMAIEDMLARLGCRSITPAATVVKALALIESQGFDFATLDINLDGQRSLAIAKVLSERGIPFAFSTGYGEHGIGDGYGNRPVLNKPFTAKQMAAVLVRIFGSTQPEPALIS